MEVEDTPSPRGVDSPQGEVGSPPGELGSPPSQDVQKEEEGLEDSEEQQMMNTPKNGTRNLPFLSLYSAPSNIADIKSLNTETVEVVELVPLSNSDFCHV